MHEIWRNLTCSERVTGDHNLVREDAFLLSTVVYPERGDAQDEKMFLRTALGSIIQLVESDSADCDHLPQ